MTRLKIAELCIFMVLIGFAFTSCKLNSSAEKAPADPTPSNVQAEDPVPAFRSPEDPGLIFSNVQAEGLIPAFPGAEGHGAIALNDCRSKPVVVHQVTNTNDSGPGSLRDAIEAAHHSNYDIIIFRTGGLITLTSTIQPRTGQTTCLYIAGQTAPGGGISIAGDRIELRGDDQVVRHLRHRGHTLSGAWRVRGSRIIYDHMTLSWGRGSPGQLSYPSLSSGPQQNKTVQNTFIYESDENHPTLFTSSASDNHVNQNFVSVHRNALFGPGHRMPKISNGGETTVANNIIYNWQGRSSGTNRSYIVDFIANYHKQGPASNNISPFLAADAIDSCPEPHPCVQSMYVAGNRNHRNDFGSSASDPWNEPNREVGCHNVAANWCNAHGDPVPSNIQDIVRRDTPLQEAVFPVDIREITDEYIDLILTRVGHSRALNCDGSWTAYGSMHEEPDKERIGWFYSGQGFSRRITVSSITVLVPAAGVPCADTDGDGLPDAWEARYYGSPTGAPAASTIAAGGYTVIEHYLNGSDPLASNSESPAPRPTSPPF